MPSRCKRPAARRSNRCSSATPPRRFAAWLATLAHRFGGGKIGIAIETSRGAIVHALLEAPGIVLYPITPRSLCRFREAFL